MKKIILSAAACLLILSACKKTEEKEIDVTTTTADTTVTAKEEAPSVEMDSAAMMKAWEDYATPGEAHKMLAMDNGTWTEESTMWMTPDDQKPTKMTMTATSKMILGGRYQEMRHTGNFMGQPFEGIGIMGYDNASKKLVSTWVDNMGTGMMRTEGDFVPGSKTIELKGRVTDPMTGKMKDIREVYTIVDDNTRKMEMYDADVNGKEFKSMEILMKRK